MKIITEDRLRELLNSPEFSNFNRERNLLVTLLRNVEEIDTLTVSKLRPMCDAPKDGSDIQLLMQSGRFVYGYNYDIGKPSRWIIPGLGSLDDDVFLGWIPSVKYEPELTGNGK